MSDASDLKTNATGQPIAGTAISDSEMTNAPNSSSVQGIVSLCSARAHYNDQSPVHLV